MKKKMSFVVSMLIITAILPASTVAFEINSVIQSPSQLSMQPSLEFYPKAHDFGYVEEGETYYTTFEIWNNGTGVLSWEIILLSQWVSVVPQNGTSTGEHDIVTVSVNTTGLSAGLHTNNIIINASNSTELYNFSIQLFINNPPDTPTKPNGPSSGVVGTTYVYSTKATDPDNDTIRYGIDIHNDGIIDHWSYYYYPPGVTYGLHIIFPVAGTYHLRFKAEDVHGAQSNFSEEKTVVISDENHPPESPVFPEGPDIGDINTQYTFSTYSIDQDNDKIRYGWDWDGDNTIDEWTGFYDSGEQVNSSHLFNKTGTYYVKVIAEDESGEQSGFSPTKSVTIIGNAPPNKPAKPTGPPQGRSGRSYTYSSSASDPDADNIYYLFSWGDGTDSGWIGPYASGQMVSESHVWNSKGSFSVKVKAKDDPNGDGDLSDGSESVWSDSLPIIMPKTKEYSVLDSRLIWLYQQFRDLFYSLTELIMV